VEPRDPREELSADLSVFLRAMARADFAWGICDCALTMADWCRRARGIDPAAPLRGRYRTARGAARTVHRRGGFEAAVCALMDAAGFAPTDAPRPGDVGIVAHPEVGPACAIRCALGWAVKGQAGVALGAFPTRAAWRL